MIKAKGTMRNGAPIVVLGLSLKNLALLQQKRPIVLNLKEFGLPETEVILFYGETEEAMKAELQDMFHPSPPPPDSDRPA